jgi:hypothetical protein
VVVTRPTELELLLQRHVTRGQVEFFLKSRARSLDELDRRHAAHLAARHAVLAAVPVEWRRATVDRADLDRFLFEPDDLVVAVGQDGLVANLAKYLDRQPVIGVNAEPDRNPGVLVTHPPERTGGLLAAAHAGTAFVERRTMVQAALDDGRRLVALNEVFVGHRGHQSARYVLRCPAGTERQSSSGIIVATGTGATGWATSIHRERGSSLALPAPTDRALAYFVREAWPSPGTGTRLTEGRLPDGAELTVVSETEDGVVFGDGIESDPLRFEWGRHVTVVTAAATLLLVREPAPHAAPGERPWKGGAAPAASLRATRVPGEPPGQVGRFLTAAVPGATPAP